MFTRIRDHFENFGSVHVIKRKEMKTKRTEATVDEVKKILAREPYLFCQESCTGDFAGKNDYVEKSQT